KSDWAFNAGIRGSLLFGQHFLLRTGLDYQQRTEVFEYADPDFIQVTIRQTIKIIDNIPVTVIDTIGVEYGEHYVKTFNRYGQLDVPIMAGVEFRNGRAGLSLQAGASLNVYFWKHGTSLDAQGSPASFTPNGNGDSRVFRQRAGWSTTASAQVFYHLRPRLRVFAEPYYHYNLRPLTLVGQPVAQRYTTWGLKLGITKILD
ncbi:MAG: outer membrane beta-barrel protein, partial [Saprospiraceae bacterium]